MEPGELCPTAGGSAGVGPYELVCRRGAAGVVERRRCRRSGFRPIRVRMRRVGPMWGGRAGRIGSTVVKV